MVFDRRNFLFALLPSLGVWGEQVSAPRNKERRSLIYSNMGATNTFLKISFFIQPFLGAKAPLELAHVKNNKKIKKMERKILEKHRVASVISDDLQCC